MRTTVKERLISFIKYKKMNKHSFEKACGFSTGFVSNMRVSLQPAKIMSIANIFPDLNTGWLLTGEGEMLKEVLPSSKHNHIEGDFIGGTFVGGHNIGSINAPFKTGDIISGNGIKGSGNYARNIKGDAGNTTSSKDNDIAVIWKENKILKEENSMLINKCESLQKQVENLTSKLLEEKERLIKMILDKK